MTPVQPDEGAVTEAAQLLAHLRLLMLFIAIIQTPARRSQPGIVASATGSTQFGPAVNFFLLNKTPAEIASDPDLLAQLYRDVAALGEAVAPASAGSIHLTAAFLGGALGVELPSRIKLLARVLVRWFVGMAVLGFVAFVAAVMLLIHTDHGRQIIGQLQDVKLQRRQALASLADVAASAPKPLPETSCASGASPMFAGSTRWQTICSRLDELKRSQSVIEQQLHNWNATSVFPGAQMGWLIGRDGSPKALAEAEWEATELEASATLANLTGIIMPMLLGLLGASAYVFRDLDRQLKAWTLYRGAAAHGALRLLLGIMLGGLLSVFWTSGTTARVDGVALSLAALAFFVGFGVEIVFQTLDTLIAGVAKKIGNEK